MRNEIVVKDIKELNQIVAGDRCFLREIFHPDRDSIDIGHSLAYAFVEAGGRTIKHYLLQEETYYLLRGKGLMHVNEVEFEVREGNSFVVPRNHIQWIENKGEELLEFLVIVTPPWNKNDEFIEE